MGNCIDYFCNPTVYRLPDEEIKKLNIGQVVWFIHRSGQKLKIHWGIIDTILFDGVVVKLYSFNDRAKVRIGDELIDYKLAPNKTEEKPLPKKWAYSTDFNIHKEYPDGVLGLYQKVCNSNNGFFKTEDSIRKLIENGTLLPNSEIDFSYYRAVIDDKTKLYRNVKTYHSSQYEYEEFQSLSRDLEWRNVFTTYEAAENEVNRINDEYDRVSSLTDEELAKEDVAKRITHFMNFNVRIKDIDICKQFHRMVMDEIEKFLEKKNKDWYDIEIRVFTKTLVYKFGRKGKFKPLIDAISEEFHDGFKDKYENYLADKES